MPKRIVLISVNTCTTPYPVYPLGVSHVAAALRAAGRDVDILDINCDRDRIAATLRAARPGLVGLSLRNIDDVNIDTRQLYVPDLVSTVALVRGEVSCPVVLGGSAFSLFPRQLMEMSGADYGVQGEGEEAVCLLAAALENGTPVDGIPGLVFRRDGTLVCNPRRLFDPAGISLPLRPVHMADYYLSRSHMFNIQTQRGCPFTCCYCTYPLIDGTRTRHRDPGDVAEELARAVAAGAHYFFFVDSVFNTDNDRAAAVCEAMIRRNLSVHWCCFLRPKNISADLMDLMARAGLRHVEFGTDSFCDRVLEAYGKRFTFDDVLQSSDLARAHKVYYAHFLVAGGPGETEETLREGFANSRRIRKTVIFPYIGMRLYPGTPLYESALGDGTVKPSDDLLKPFFYITPGLSGERIRELLLGFKQESMNWMFGETPPELAAVADRLRQKGVEGPLWEFLIR